jgi:hypothetical protein
MGDEAIGGGEVLADLLLGLDTVRVRFHRRRREGHQ